MPIVQPTQNMAAILAQAKNSPSVKALAAGSAAQQAMAAATDPDSYADAAAKLAAAFDTIKAEFIVTYPHLAHAISAHQAKLADGDAHADA